MVHTINSHVSLSLEENNEQLEDKERNHGRLSIIREFAHNTSAHGIPGIVRSRSITNRIFWTVSFLGFTSILGYFIIQTIKTFFSFPTQTIVLTTVERVQTFPAVSICNYSPLRLDVFIQAFMDYTNSRNLTNVTDNSTISHTQAQYIRDFIKYLLDNGELIAKYTYPLNSMLMYCVYNGQYCSYNDFLSFSSSTFGTCYTFNAKTKSNATSVRHTIDNGGPGRLELRLYTHRHQYVPFVTQDVIAGIIIMIHDNTELPLIELGGIPLATGLKHRLSYKKRSYELLPQPYSNCTVNVPLVMQAMFNQYQGADYRYSQAICNSLCKQAYVYEQCKCVNPYEWVTRFIASENSSEIINAKLCNINDKCYINATDRITKTDSIWNKFCSECSQACSTTDFLTTVSSVSAPSSTYLYSFKEFVENSSIPLPTNWNQSWQTEIEKNYVAVDIISETSYIEMYTQDPLMSWVDLLANIGGHTGLWIGISFLSIMEFAEMLYRLIRYEWDNIHKRLRRQIKK